MTSTSNSLRKAYELAAQSPEALLRYWGIETPYEIDVVQFATALGARVEYDRLFRHEALLSRARDSAVITVQSSSKDYRQEFSIAHELGHLVHDPRAFRFSCSSRSHGETKQGGRSEWRANRFAVGVLMPDYMVRPLIAGKPVEFDLVGSVASAFHVGWQTAAARVVELTSRPSMYVRYAANRKTWVERSSMFPRGFWPYDDLYRGTAGLMAFESNIRRTEQMVVAGECWFAHPAAKYFRVIEDSVVLGDVVLSLLEWTRERKKGADPVVEINGDRTHVGFQYGPRPLLVHSRDIKRLREAEEAKKRSARQPAPTERITAK